jgi:phosphonate transport system substrate-binding protein
MQFPKARLAHHFVILLAILLILSCRNPSSRKSYTPAYSKKVDVSKTLLLGLPNFSFYDSFDALCKYLSNNLPGGFRVQPVATVTFDEYVNRAIKGEFDITFTNGEFALRLDTLDYSIIAKVKDDDRYRGVILTRKDSVFKNVKDLRQRIICCPGINTLAGAKMPLYFLASKGINVKNELKILNAASFESVFMNVYLGKSSAGTAWLESWESFKKMRPDITSSLEVRWETAPLVNVAMLVKNNVDGNIKEALLQLLIDLPKTDEGRKLLLQTGYGGFEKADASNYLPVKKFLESYDKTIRGLTIL